MHITKKLHLYNIIMLVLLCQISLSAHAGLAINDQQVAIYDEEIIVLITDDLLTTSGTITASAYSNDVEIQSEQPSPSSDLQSNDGVTQTIYDAGAFNVQEITYQTYASNINPVLPIPVLTFNYFSIEETNSTGYHYIISAPAGAYKAEGMLQLPVSFKLNEHPVQKQTMNNDVPYYFFGIYTSRGGIDVGICWQKTPTSPQGTWVSFCTVFPKDGAFYTHKAGKDIPNLELEQVLHMAAIQYDNGVRLELSMLELDGSLTLIHAVDFDIPDLALRADGRGTFFNREISLAQHRINYKNGAEMIGAKWWDAKLHWHNYSSAWDSGVVSLARTRWEPVAELRVSEFKQKFYDAEEVSFIYKDLPNKIPAGH